MTTQRIMKAFALVAIITLTGKVSFAQLNFYYTSGRLFEDPRTSSPIKSPYLAYYWNDELEWIAYDPDVEEGRFVSISSTYTTAVACGFVRGSLKLLDHRIDMPSDNYTGVAISVSPNQEVEWLYAHKPGLTASKFHWAQKLVDGKALLSGYEYQNDKKTAILLRINKAGEVTWTKRLEHRIGLEVKSTKKDQIFWMTTDQDHNDVTICDLHQFTGDVNHEITLKGRTSSAGLRYSKTFFLSEQYLLAARLTDTAVLFDEFDLAGLPVLSASLPYESYHESYLELQGVTRRPNGNIQLALNLHGSVSIAGKEPVHALSDKEILLITLDGSGNYVGLEKYGSRLAGVNGIFHVNGKVAIAGSYEGKLKIQSQVLDGHDYDTVANAYRVYVDDYNPKAYDSPASIPDELPVDPTTEIYKLNIYPNPATTGRSITIVDRNALPGIPFEIRIYDKAAKLHIKKAGKAMSKINREQIDITSLPAGAFQVFVVRSHAVTHRGKFIIAR